MLLAMSRAIIPRKTAARHAAYVSRLAAVMV
jgi:hypothetical protein